MGITKKFIGFLFLISQVAWTQGHQGAVDWTTDTYILDTGGTQATMGTQTWINGATTATQRGQSVTTDASQMQPNVIAPVGSEQQPNIYQVSTGGPTTWPSPGPGGSTTSTSTTSTTSTTSSSSSTTTSSGMSIPSGDILLWSATYYETMADTMRHAPGRDWFDHYCHLEATQMSSAGNWTYNGGAVAIMSNAPAAGDNNCKRDASFSSIGATAKVWSPTSAVTSHEVSPTWNALFTTGITNLINTKDGTDVSTVRHITGCRDTGIIHTHDCDEFTNISAFMVSYGDQTDPLPSYKWLESGGTHSCSHGSIYVSFYCAFESGATSSSTSSGFPANDDIVLWTSDTYGTMNDVVGVGGGRAWFDNKCHEEALSMNTAGFWDYTSGAVALMAKWNETGDNNCKRDASFSSVAGTAKVWSPTSFNSFAQVATTWNNIFSSGFQAAPNQKNGMIRSWLGRVSGCNNDGTNDSIHQCDDWSNTSNTNKAQAANVIGPTFPEDLPFSSAGSGWDCNANTNDIAWFCAFKVNATSSSSSSSTSSSTSSPNPHDNFLLTLSP